MEESGYVMFVRDGSGLAGVSAGHVLVITHVQYVHDKYFGNGLDVVMEKPAISIRICNRCGKIRMRQGNTGQDICDCFEDL